SQRTFTFTSPTSADTVTIDGQQISLAANASASDLASAVNSNSSSSVWATVTGTNSQTGQSTIVLSDRAHGAPATAGQFIQVSDTSGSLTEQTQYAQAGVNAQYTINGVAGQSSSN